MAIPATRGRVATPFDALVQKKEPTKVIICKEEMIFYKAKAEADPSWRPHCPACIVDSKQNNRMVAQVYGFYCIVCKYAVRKDLTHYKLRRPYEESND